MAETIRNTPLHNAGVLLYGKKYQIDGFSCFKASKYDRAVFK